MAHQATKSWRAVRGQRPLNERDVARHRQDFDAEAGLLNDADEGPRRDDARPGEDRRRTADERAAEGDELRTG